MLRLFISFFDLASAEFTMNFCFRVPDWYSDTIHAVTVIALKKPSKICLSHIHSELSPSDK